MDAFSVCRESWGKMHRTIFMVGECGALHLMHHIKFCKVYTGSKISPEIPVKEQVKAKEGLS